MRDYSGNHINTWPKWMSVPSTVFRCRSDRNNFGELLGHKEIKNGQKWSKMAIFRPKMAILSPFLYWRDRKVMNNVVKWMKPRLLQGDLE